MTEEQRAQVKLAHWELPKGCRHAPATEDQLRSFEVKFATIPEDYRWYLLKCGGGVIGSEWIDGITELPETHRKFKEGSYSLRNFFPVGWDGSGNPYGFDTITGKIVTEDHDFGGVHEEAGSFYHLLRVKGLIDEEL